MDAFPFEATALINLHNVRARDLARDQLFQAVWLRHLLPEGEWRGIAHLPLSLVKELYRDVWMLGPYAAEYKVFWGAFLRKLLGATLAARKVMLNDLLDTYRDSILMPSLQLQRHLYLDSRHAFAYGDILQMGWYGDTGQRLFKAVWSASPGITREERQRIEAALGLMIITILAQHLTPNLAPERWAEMQRVHNDFCARWGLPSLSSTVGAHVS